MIGCEDDVAAYFFDRACALLGRSIEDDIEKSTDGKGKAAAEAIASNVIANWTGGKLKFADPSPTR